MPRHKQVRVKYGKLDEHIDELIAPLILEMWRAGIKTNMSCQSTFENKKIWVEFPDTMEVATFLTIVTSVFKPGKDSLHNRIDFYWVPDNWKAWELKCWEFEIFAVDASIDHGETWEGDVRVCPPLWYFTISVRFPKSDLPIVIERLQEHNKLKKRTGGKIFAIAKTGG